MSDATIKVAELGILDGNRARAMFRLRFEAPFETVDYTRVATEKRIAAVLAFAGVEDWSMLAGRLIGLKFDGGPVSLCHPSNDRPT